MTSESHIGVPLEVEMSGRAAKFLPCKSQIHTSIHSPDSDNK